MKELLEESVRADVDGLPFTEDGYSSTKAILEAEYGQTTEVVNAYVRNIMRLPVVDGADPKRINDFLKQLRYNVQSLETLGKLADVKGNVRSILDKVKGIKADLVRGNEGWQEWNFNDLLRELKKWREINPIDEDIDKIPPKGRQLNSRSRFSHARDDKRVRSCVYCEDSTHKSVACPKIITTGDRRKILSKKKPCFNCPGSQHQATNCKSKTGCQKCHKRHHTSICNPPEERLLTVQHGSNIVVTYPVVIVEVEGIKCRALLDTGAGSSYASAALLDRLPKRESKRETRKIEMMLGTTTREMELQTVNIKRTFSQFSIPVEVTKVQKGELVFIDNPRYQQLISENPHFKGIVMEDVDKEKLPVHIILGASEYAKLKTDTVPRNGKPGEPVAELTRIGWTIISGVTDYGQG